jgi:hypothetical protein
MTRFHLEHGKRYRCITFLCQHCGGELEVTGERYADETVWQCLSCTGLWIYTLAGWGRVKGLGVMRRVARSDG